MRRGLHDLPRVWSSATFPAVDGDHHARGEGTFSSRLGGSSMFSSPACFPWVVLGRALLVLYVAWVIYAATFHFVGFRFMDWHVQANNTLCTDRALASSVASLSLSEQLEGACTLPSEYQFEKVLWFVTDGHARHYVEHLLPFFQNQTVMYDVVVSGFKWSHAIYSSWWTGLPAKNLFGSQIQGDHLWKSMERGGRMAPFNYVGPHWSFAALLGDEGRRPFQMERFVDEEESQLIANNLTYEPYPLLVDGAYKQLLRMSQHAKHSLVLHTGIFDKINHNGESDRLDVEATKLDELFLTAKAWVDDHPDYLLILSSDHGVDCRNSPPQWTSDQCRHNPNPNEKLHGDGRNLNTGYMLFYSPTWKPFPRQIERAIDVVDVAPTLSKYFAGTDIPFNSYGIPQNYYGPNGTKDVANAYRQAVYQLCNKLSSREGAHQEDVCSEESQFKKNRSMLKLRHLAKQIKQKLYSGERIFPYSTVVVCLFVMVCVSIKWGVFDFFRSRARGVAPTRTQSSLGQEMLVLPISHSMEDIGSTTWRAAQSNGGDEAGRVRARTLVARESFGLDTSASTPALPLLPLPSLPRVPSSGRKKKVKHSHRGSRRGRSRSPKAMDRTPHERSIARDRSGCADASSGLGGSKRARRRYSRERASQRAAQDEHERRASAAGLGRSGQSRPSLPLTPTRSLRSLRNDNGVAASSSTVDAHRGSATRPRVRTRLSFDGHPRRHGPRTGVGPISSTTTTTTTTTATSRNNGPSSSAPSKGPLQSSGVTASATSGATSAMMPDDSSSLPSSCWGVGGLVPGVLASAMLLIFSTWHVMYITSELNAYTVSGEMYAAIQGLLVVAIALVHQEKHHSDVSRAVISLEAFNLGVWWTRHAIASAHRAWGSEIAPFHPLGSLASLAFSACVMMRARAWRPRIGGGASLPPPPLDSGDGTSCPLAMSSGAAGAGVASAPSPAADGTVSGGGGGGGGCSSTTAPVVLSPSSLVRAIEPLDQAVLVIHALIGAFVATQRVPWLYAFAGFHVCALVAFLSLPVFTAYALVARRYSMVWLGPYMLSLLVTNGSYTMVAGGIQCVLFLPRVLSHASPATAAVDGGHILAGPANRAVADDAALVGIDGAVDSPAPQGDGGRGAGAHDDGVGSHGGGGGVDDDDQGMGQRLDVHQDPELGGVLPLAPACGAALASSDADAHIDDASAAADGLGQDLEGGADGGRRQSSAGWLTDRLLVLYTLNLAFFIQVYINGDSIDWSVEVDAGEVGLLSWNTYPAFSATMMVYAKFGFLLWYTLALWRYLDGDHPGGRAHVGHAGGQSHVSTHRAGVAQRHRRHHHLYRRRNFPPARGVGGAGDAPNHRHRYRPDGGLGGGGSQRDSSSHGAMAIQASPHRRHGGGRIASASASWNAFMALLCPPLLHLVSCLVVVYYVAWYWFNVWIQIDALFSLLLIHGGVFALVLCMMVYTRVISRAVAVGV